MTLEAETPAAEAAIDANPLTDTAPAARPEAAEPSEAVETVEAVEAAEPDDEPAKRLARLAHDAREARRQARALKAEIDALKSGRTPEPDAEMDRRIAARAEELAMHKAFADKCNAIYADGVTSFGRPAFDSAVAEVNAVFDGNMPPQFVEAAHEAGEPHKIIAYLAENPDKLDEIAAMSAHRMGAALAKIGSKLAAPPPPKAVSKAPAPIKTVTGNAKGDFDPLTCSIEEFMAHDREAIWTKKMGAR